MKPSTAWMAGLAISITSSLIVCLPNASAASFVIDDFNPSPGFFFEVDNDPLTVTPQSQFLLQEISGVFEGVRDCFFETMSNNESGTEHGTLRLDASTSGQVILSGVGVYLDFEWGDIVEVPPTPADPGDIVRIELGYSTAPLVLWLALNSAVVASYENIPASPGPFVLEIPITEFESASGLPMVPATYTEMDLEMWVAGGAAGEFALDSISVVPEPSILLLLLLGLAALGIRRSLLRQL